jgi:hypothetical protein
MPSSQSIEMSRISSASPSLRRTPNLTSPSESFIDAAPEVSRMKKMQIVLLVVALIVFLHIERDIGTFGDMSNATKATKAPHLSPPRKVPSAPALAPLMDDDEASPSPIISGEISTPSTQAYPATPPSSPSSGDDSPFMLTSGSREESDGDEDDDDLKGSDDSSPPYLSPSYAPVAFVTKNLTLPDISLSQQQQEFSQQNCDLSSLDSWYPSSPENSWEFRAPYVVIAGVWNSGSNTFAKRLYTHPQISKVATKANGFYKHSNFYKFTSPNTKVFAARQRMYAQAYDAKLLRSSPNLVAMDVSPGYLFYAQQVSQNILCVSPWAKIVILLRNPIDRVYEQYARAKEIFGLRISLEQWIANEMQLITSSGLIGKEPDSAEEKEAWKTYQRVRSMANAMGRSLYVFQLEEWLTTYKQAGKVPSKEIYIVPSEVLEQEDKFQEEYNKVLSFLGLSTVPIDSGMNRDPALYDTTAHMTEETRKTLEKFFKPYNKRLFKLLEQEGFPDYSLKSLWKSKADV